MTQAILAAHSYSTRAIEIIIEAFKTFKQERAAEKLAKQTMKELSRLTDKELNDIGLSRGDIWYVAHNQNENLRGWV
jgi:uncharacterized protein YjiS (DUF1127 family)